MSTKRPQTLLLMELTLLPQKEPFERDCVKALGSLDPDIGLLISGPSWQEEPDVFHNPIMGAAIASCQLMGRKFYWGRDVWIRWKERAAGNGWKQRINDLYTPSYWAAYLSRLAVEAATMGAKGTFAQCEPHGDTIYKPWFKTEGLVDGRAGLVRDTIRAALWNAPAATIAKPAGSVNPEHFSWPMQHIAKQRLCTKTDKLRRASDLADIVNPPKGEKLQVHRWRSVLTSRHNANPEGKLTVSEWRAIDWAEVQRLYPECQGWVIKAENDCMLAVMQELGEAGR